MSDYSENIYKLLETNTQAAIEQLEREHKAGNLISTYLLGKIYFDGIFSQIDGKKAISYLIIPGLFEPPVRTLRATIPEIGSHIFR